MVSAKSVCFGMQSGAFDTGVEPAIAINRGGTVVEVHRSQKTSGLWWWLGTLDGISITWGGHATVKDDGGYEPSVALTDSGVVIEVHQSTNNSLWYWTGQCSGATIDWKDHGNFDDGREPSVAVNAAGVVVEVHRAGNGALWWWLGQLNGTSIAWNVHATLKDDSGYNPAVAINAAGMVVEVHQSYAGDLWYWLGHVQNNTIAWSGHEKIDAGTHPTATLGDDNMVYVAYEQGATLYQRTGRLGVGKIEWIDWLGTGTPSHHVNEGTRPAIASNGRAAVLAQQSTLASGLCAEGSLLFNRAGWMGDNLARIGAKKLNELALPASHDSGMYLGGSSLFDLINLLGKTQDLDIYGQLSYGVRYFDLRPEVDGASFTMYHGVAGARLADVLAQIRKFFDEGHKELVILKFSHFKNFDPAAFDRLCRAVQNPTTGIGSWLYHPPSSPAPLPRLAERTLSSFVAARGAVIAVFEGSEAFPASPSPSGLYRYRDWESPDPANGDLTVFDIYSDTMLPATMESSTQQEQQVEKTLNIPRGQLPKFAGFDGTCKYDAATPCDLFLLSWTLTPPTAVWPFSCIANGTLANKVAGVGPNANGKIINLLYTDYLQYSRSTDIAVIRNGCPPP